MPGCVILLIEDDENDAFFVKRALTQLGFPGRVHHVTETEEAKKYIRGEDEFRNREEFPSPDIIVADSAVSSKESGVELLEWVRASGSHPDVPFIIFSGGVSDETRRRAEAAGVRKILMKTSSREQLLARLREILEQCPKASRPWLR